MDRLVWVEIDGFHWSRWVHSIEQGHLFVEEFPESKVDQQVPKGSMEELRKRQHDPSLFQGFRANSHFRTSKKTSGSFNGKNQ